MYYLKANVLAEPLVNHWYASLNLLSPAMAALIFSSTHQKIMASYVSSPQLHEMATRNPETAGGPFIDYPTRRVDEVKQLLEQAKSELVSYVQFADDVKKLQHMLDKHPQGMSLEPLYGDLPESLRGYVELYYDLLNRPHFRLIEALLYHGSLNTAPLQSMVFSLISEDYRPFCLSTPRLPAAEQFRLVLPFKDELYDRVFRSREQPLSQEDFDALVQIAGSESQVAQFFSTEKSPNYFQALSSHESLRVRYFAHACVLIETPQCSILIDPVISYDYPSELPRFTYADLPEKIDYVVLTHAHQDHVLLEHLLQLRYKIGTIFVPANVPGALQDPSLKLMLEDLGFPSVRALAEFERVTIVDGFIQGLPFLGEHADLHIQSKLMYFIRIADTKILLAADANNLDYKLYERVYEVIGDIDLLFIGMECVGAPLSWLYQPLLLTQLTRDMDQSRRLDGSDFNKAKMMVDTFNCKKVYVYAMGQEPWLNYVMGTHYTPTSPAIIESDKLLDYCRSKDIESARLLGSTKLSK